MFSSHSKLVRYLVPVAAVAALVYAMSGTWATARSAVAAPITRPISRPSTTSPSSTAPPSTTPHPSASASGANAAPTGRTTARLTKKAVVGKLNLNTATEEQLLLLPGIGPSKAERIVMWRKRNNGFRRIADLRRVKGFGYKTFKRLEPFLDVQGESTLTTRR